jgi:hypothetical protein
MPVESETRRARRSHGGTIHDRRQIELARRLGQAYKRPEPIRYTPEQRLDWETFIKPNIAELGPDVTSHMPTIEDFYNMRYRVFFHDADATQEATEFTTRHNQELDDVNVARSLKPAFDLIRGRFQQAANAHLSHR